MGKNRNKGRRGKNKNSSWLSSLKNVAGAMLFGNSSSEQKAEKKEEDEEYEASYSSSPTASLHNEDLFTLEPEMENSEELKTLENIKRDYLKLYKKFYENTNDKNGNVCKEFEEEFSRLIYRVDDIAPINDQIKKCRTELIKTINNMVDVVCKQNQTTHDNTEKSGINFKEFLPIINEALQPAIEPMECDSSPAEIESCKDMLSQDATPSTSVEPYKSNTKITVVNSVKQQTSEENYEGPVQLLLMNTETGLFELDEAAVKSVLLQPQVKNRKIAIVSIVGAFRRGKSFLLNFMLRYLNAQGSPDWLEQSDKLEGFSWRGGKNRDTTGILMWSKPFLVGDDIAVVLMDTQGTFDNQTSMKANTFIFALSTLLSSVQIYNLHERIQMDDLSNLQYFLEFGRMVQKASNTKVFENLIFLIRDWNFDDENKYGFEGGVQVLKEWLKFEKDSITQQQSELIDTCFNTVSCFLMPHPGSKVSKNTMFQGHLKDIKPEFLAHLKPFIESIFNGSMLSGKQIGGEFVNAEQFLMYMTTYVDKLQHPDIEPKTLFQSMCDTSHSQVVSQCKESYMREMQRAVREVTYDIQAAHQHAVNSALALYASTPKFGAVYDNNLYKKKLLQLLEECYRGFVQEFERQIESKLHEACTNVYDNYQATLNAFCMQLQPQCSLEDKCKEACKQAVEVIKNLNLKMDQVKIDGAATCLIKKMETYYELQVPSYKARQKQENKLRMNLLKQDVLQCYQTLMDSYCGGPDVVTEFDSVHTKAQMKALEILNTGVKKYNLHKSTGFIAHINKEMDKICECYTKHNQRKIDKEMENKFKLLIEKSHHQAIEVYRLQMDAECGGLKTAENFKDLHNNAKQNALNTYTPCVKQYGKEACEPFLMNTCQKMETYYELQVPSYKARQKQENKLRMNLLKQDVLQCYQTLMDSYCGGPDVVTEFDSVHTKAQMKALEILNTGVKKYNLHKSTGFIAHINKEMDKICECYTKHNQRKIDKEMENKFKLLIEKSHHQAIEVYRLQMDAECGGLKTAENFKDLHNNAKQNALNTYTPCVKQYGKEACEPFLMNTCQTINMLHSQYAATNTEKLQRNTHERAQELLNAGLHLYDKEMQMLDIGNQPIHNLSEIHENIKTEALNQLKPASKSYCYNKYLKRLEEIINRKYSHHEQQNIKAIQHARLEKVKYAQEQCVRVYAEKMDALEIDQHPVEDLSDKHDSIKEDALAGLKDFLTDEETPVLQDVEMEINKKWQNYIGQNEKITEMFKNEELRTVKCAFNQIKAEYVTNMNKNKDACLETKNVAELFQFHEKENEMALANFQEMTSECSEENRKEYLNKLEYDIKRAFEDAEESLGTSLRVLRIKEEELTSGPKKSYAIGIDLGTTNSCAAVYRNGRVEMIYSDKLSDKNKTTTPSVVYFGENEILFGETAVVKGFVDPKNCISEMKRIIGRSFDDPVVQSLIDDWPFDVSDSNGKPVVNVKYEMQKSYKPEEVSSLVLGEMKRIAEVYLGSQVHDAVVTIPAYFNELQREATKAACVKAGLNVLRMINEPTAAAIAYGLQCKSELLQTLLVFDFGGGTCDISIATVEGEKFTVKASNGDNKLGGEDFDDRLTEHVAEIIEAKYNVKIDVKEKRRLRHNCERVKKNLTQDTKYVLQIEQFTDAKVDVEVHVEREKFEELNEDLFKRALMPVEECLKEAKLRAEEIDEVVLVGGSSRIPKIRQMLRKYFKGKKMNININPDEAIAYGAAIQAGICTEEYGGDINIFEITPISLGIQVVGNIFSIIIPKSTKIPIEYTKEYWTVFDNQENMRITAYQGECRKASRNEKIGEFTLENIKIAPAGETSVFVTFTIDVDGILHVKAVEKGKENNKKLIKITKNVM